MKYLAIGLLLLSLIGCSVAPMSFDIHEVIIDNQTTQRFRLLINGRQSDTLEPGGTISVIILDGVAKKCQLRWVGKDEIGTLVFTLDRGVTRVYVKGKNNDYYVICSVSQEKTKE